MHHESWSYWTFFDLGMRRRFSLTVVVRGTHLCRSHPSEYPAPATICVSHCTVTFCLVLTSALLILTFLLAMDTNFTSTVIRCIRNAASHWIQDGDRQRVFNKAQSVTWQYPRWCVGCYSHISELSGIKTVCILINCTSAFCEYGKLMWQRQKNSLTWFGFRLQ